MISYMLYLGILTLSGEVHYTPVRSYGTLAECEQRGAFAVGEIVKVSSIVAAESFCVQSTDV